MSKSARRAVLRVFEDEPGPLHWTKVQDLALQRGDLDPFAGTDLRRSVLRALADLAAEGVIEKVGKGSYRRAG